MTFKSHQFLNFNIIWKPYLKRKKDFFLVCIKNALCLLKKSSKMFDIFFKYSFYYAKVNLKMLKNKPKFGVI